MLNPCRFLEYLILSFYIYLFICKVYLYIERCILLYSDYFIKTIRRDNAHGATLSPFLSQYFIICVTRNGARTKARLIHRSCMVAVAKEAQYRKSLTSGPSMGLISPAPPYFGSAHGMVAAVSSGAGESRYRSPEPRYYKSTSSAMSS